MDARHRIMDACANRGREALRTMEDVARFRLGERGLCAAIKAIRHDLRAVMADVPGGELGLAANRDTPGDVGTGVKGAGEGGRVGLRDVAIAAGKRAGEALRTLEETAKTVDATPSLWTRLEALRYRLYEVEKRLVLAMGTGGATQWRLCVVITESLCRRPWLSVAAECIRAGADCLQLREPGMADGELLGRAVALRGLIDEAGPPRGTVSLIVNDRVDVALLSGADGVHLGVGDLPIAAARQLCGDRLLIGASTHTIDEARAAVTAGADYCGVGAMFATKTKACQVSGVEYLRAYLGEFSHVPHLAIGGISTDNARILVDAGARGLAISSAVCGAERPGAVCERLLGVLAGSSPRLEVETNLDGRG